MLRNSAWLISRRLTVLLIAGGFVSLHSQQQQPAGEHPSAASSPQRVLINQYCVGCHNGKLKSGASRSTRSMSGT